MLDPSRQDPARLEDFRQQIRALRGSPADIPRRAELCRQALELVSPQVQPELWAGLHFEWGICLIQMQTGDRTQNLEEAIARFNQALEVYTYKTHPVEWASVHHNLGAIYRQRLAGDRGENQEEAIRCYERALSVFTQTDWPQDWADVTFNLANVFTLRIQGQPRKNLEHAIAGYEATLHVYTRQAHPVAWAKVQCQLGRAWSNYQWNILAANVDKALQHYQAALAVLTLQDHPVEWSVVQHGLGTAWLKRINGDHDDNVMQAIQCFDAALQIRRRELEPADWADTMHNLGVAYLQSYRGDRAKNVERAIEIFEQILAVETLDAAPLKAAGVTCKLADAYFENVYGERAANLEHAIDLYRSALQIQRRCGTSHDWGPTLHNLAVAYSERRVGSRINNLKRAAACGTLALRAFDLTHTLLEWATVKTDLIDILWKLANIQQHADPLGAAKNLEDAIVHGEEALAALEPQAPSHQQALAHYNLGNAYSDRLAGVRGDNQTKAIDHYEQALRFYTRSNYPLRWADTHNNLGVTYQEYMVGDHTRNLSRAIDHYNQALTACAPDTVPVLARRAARNLGHLHFQEQHWLEAIVAYQSALQAAEHLYRASLARSSKEVELAETADLYRYAAYAMARSGDGAGACIALELGRARLLFEALELDQTNLKQLEALGRADLYNRYLAIAKQIRNLEDTGMRPGRITPGVDFAASLPSIRGELDSIVASIRQIQGYEEFFQAPDFDRIRHDLLVDHLSIGVYLTVTRMGGLAMIVHSTGVEALRLDGFSEADLGSLLTGQEKNKVVGGYLPGQFGHGMVGALDEGLPIIGERVIAPVAERLRDLNAAHVTLIPTGLMSLLPLHAALYQRDGRQMCLLDEFDMAYTPSARVLGRARQRLNSRQETKPVLAGVGDPLDNPRPLPYARPELEEIATFFAEDARHPFYERAATKETLLAATQTATYVHLSCHGLFDPDDPLNSHLQLANGDPLSLREVMHSGHFERARLVVLSACQTAITDFNKLPDEAIGLPAGFFQAGVPGVVGTLWSVNDLSTMLLMGKFYEVHLKEGLAPAAALRTAQLWLRDVTNADLYSLVQHDCQQADLSDQTRLVLALARRQFRDAMLSAPYERPFAHPYYWAAFAFYGV